MTPPPGSGLRNVCFELAPQLLNDVSFNADIQRLAIRRVQAAAQPTYLYRFNVEDEYNVGRSRRRLDRPGRQNTPSKIGGPN